MTVTTPAPTTTGPATADVLSALSQLIRTSRTIARQRQDQLGASGTPVTVLKALLHAAEGRDRPGDLAVAAGVAPSVVSRVIARLVVDGLVTRRPDETDARACRISITPAGRDQVAAIDRAYSALLDEALGQLSAEDLERIPAVLRRLEAALTRAAELASPVRTAPARTSPARTSLHESR